MQYCNQISESKFEYGAEVSGITFNIVTKGYEQADVKGVIDSLSFALPDSGLIDPLSPWKGEDDYILDGGSKTVVHHTLNAKRLN